jgi:hypothetical protein
MSTRETAADRVRKAKDEAVADLKREMATRLVEYYQESYGLCQDGLDEFMEEFDLVPPTRTYKLQISVVYEAEVTVNMTSDSLKGVSSEDIIVAINNTIEPPDLDLSNINWITNCDLTDSTVDVEENYWC